MIKFENTEVFGMKAAIRGMRNPMNSWNKSDSGMCETIPILCKDCTFKKENEKEECTNQTVDSFLIGINDYKLMKSLIKAGTDHSKFMRMITVTVDITAPLYWWKEFDTYKVGTVRNSCSTMHKIMSKEFEFEDFSCEHLYAKTKAVLKDVIIDLNELREMYLNGNYTSDQKKHIWYNVIQMLPSSYNQRATVQLNYQVLRSIYHSDRKHHKLDEWREGFMDWIRRLPYSELITE